MRLLPIQVSLLLAATASAQLPTWVPWSLAFTEGGGASEAPGDWVPLQMQTVYNASAILSTGLISRIDWRRDGSLTSYGATTQQVAISLSAAGVEAPEYTVSTYAKNRGTDYKQVFSGQVSYPPEGPVNMPPASFNLKVPLTTSFLLTPGKNLLVEFVVTGTTFTTLGWKGDSTAGLTVTPEGTLLPTGSAGCPATFVDAFVGQRPWPGAPMVVRSPTGATASVPGVTAVGVAYATPIDLTFINAPGCSLVHNVLLQIPVVSDPAGIVTSDFGRLPKNPALKGGQISLQTFALDAGFNALGLRVSAGFNYVIGNGFPAGLDAHSYYDRQDNTASLATAATFRSTRSPVIQLN